MERERRSSSSLQGFTTDISVNAGDTVHFKVDTTAATFNMDIYRMGYYGGMGARKVGSIAGIAGQDQPNCLSNSATGGRSPSGATRGSPRCRRPAARR